MPQESIATESLYLDLMKKCLVATIYDESAWHVLGSRQSEHPALPRERAKQLFVWLGRRFGFLIVKPVPFDAETERRLAIGRHRPLFGYTMIGLVRLNNIQECIEDVIRNHVEGDIIETGAWRGGATIFMRAVLKYHGVTDRMVWVADSFEGLPSLTAGDTGYEADASVDAARLNNRGPMGLGLAVSVDRVKKNFAKFGLLDDQVRFLKGWFRDTLPAAPIDKLAVLRLDGDLYQSTMDALNALYRKVSVGGFVIVDDYNSWPHCKQAVDEFRAAHGIRDDIVAIDEDSVFWRVSGPAITPAR